MKPAAMAERIELWEVDRLKPYEHNARTHSDEQVRQVAASISQFGFVNPILIDGDEGVIAGHCRLAAAIDLGMTEVPVVVLDHLTPDQRRAYILADNQLALNAGWDENVLAQELASLQLADFDLPVIGFDEDELQRLLDPENIDDLEDGINATAGSDELEDADTQVVVGGYRFELERGSYIQWRDAIRDQVGFEDEDIKAEIRRRLQIPA